MTDIQVKYWQLQEEKRHNQTYEQETQRHNVVTEQQGFLSLDEAVRHNKETEKLGWSNLEETTRHNKATEEFSYASLAETQRHNVATEGIQQIQADAAWMNAKTNAYNAQTNRLKYNLDYAKANYDINYTIAATTGQELKNQSQFIANKQAKRDWELRDENYELEQFTFPMTMLSNALGGLGKVVSSFMPK